MWIVRPARHEDLAGIEKLATGHGARVSTLPQSRDKLSEKIDHSLRSLASDPALLERERFLFVLEDSETGKIHGTAGIDARAGNGQPFYNYRRDELIHASHELDVSKRVAVLYPTHELTGDTLLCSFTIDPELRDGDAFELLSRSRLLFIDRHRERFANDLVVEIQGVQTEEGDAPFWDSLGRHFFHMDFATADYYSGVKSKTFIAELMPPNPIYVTLLSEAAQTAISQPHEAAERTCQLLEREGFRMGKHIDIFDGGPVLEARTDALSTLTSRRIKTVRRGEGSRGLRYLVANGESEAFRCTLTNVSDGLGDVVRLNTSVADVLQVSDGDDLILVAL
ncbi:arginine N-succinyltransferase [Marinobacter fonticola]|uniref:arginine N-succinyltransferase n=1 Tax=Marinobacter fonticola TaxID=2603215 RepID=UPI0011E78F48|nr:arginine N-succinyltransferase [Marinobacter fonticola]